VSGRLPASPDELGEFLTVSAPEEPLRRQARPRRGEPEPADHREAKKALLAWAGDQGLAAYPELRMIVDTHRHRHRLADVGIDVGYGEAWALEVEYKQAGAADWDGKQADYDEARIGCTWILGHTRVNAATERAAAILGGTTLFTQGLVRVPHIARQISHIDPPARRSVYLINPTLRLIGTLVQPDDPGRLVTLPLERKPGERYTYAAVVLDPLEECRFRMPNPEMFYAVEDPSAGFWSPAATTRSLGR